MLRDSFWLRIVIRVLIVAWVPTLTIAGLGIIGAGSRASVAGDVAATLLLYVIFVTLSLIFGPRYWRRLEDKQNTRKADPPR